ncbi:MAG: 8-amino-7-oxononanoate synthase [Roseibacillus sp.]|nr:8-amino-7-oxononanoate synthase [Roseibacillus sp.]
MRQAEDELAALREVGLLRQLRQVETDCPPLLRIDGRPVVNFASNDYLGLAHDEELIAAAREATTRHGTGSASSRLISGSSSPHLELEEYIAEWKGAEAALSFSSGYAAAVGTLDSLLKKGDVVILDKLCHASLIDGARQSGATLRVYPHNNLQKLARLLADNRANLPADGRLLVVTESVFSMDGDRAPLLEIVELVEQHGALLLLDEAHAVGVLGSTGQGLAEELGLQERIAFQMGTLGKAVGSAGGYLAAGRKWIDLLLNGARPFIYSTAPPPAQVAASRCGLKVIASSRGRELRERLWSNIATFSRLRETDIQSAIVPLPFGENQPALQAACSLLEAGYLAPAIRFPTVPRGSARLRITLSALHTEEHLRGLHEKLLTFS